MKKDKTNWFYITLGLFFIAGFLVPTQKPVDKNNLSALKIFVSRVQKISSHKSSEQYRIYANNYQSLFKINAGGCTPKAGKIIDGILTNDTLEISIPSNRLNDLNNEHESIPIYAMQKGNEQVYTVSDYNAAQKTYSDRWGLIFLTMGVLFLLRGFALISSKVAYILGGVSLIGLVVYFIYNN